MARNRWTPTSAQASADLSIWWATLTDQEQLLVRSEAWCLAGNTRLLDFLALTECPLVVEPFDPKRRHVLSNPGRFLTFLNHHVSW